MSQSTMSYGQALNEARQMIIQQQYRIKADADKIKAQQQQIVDQSAVLVESEHKLKDQAAEIQRISQELQAAHERIAELTTAREQAEAVIDRQGQRLTAMQAAAAEMEQKIAEHTAQIAALTTERDHLAAQLPTPEDEEALASMSDLLAKRPANGRKQKGQAHAEAPTIRLAEVFSDGPVHEHQEIREAA
jgi:chromosome segregation ATPase